MGLAFFFVWSWQAVSAQLLRGRHQGGYGDNLAQALSLWEISYIENGWRNGANREGEEQTGQPGNSQECLHVLR